MAERRAARAVLIGAEGRMGRAVAAAAANDGAIEIVARIVSSGGDLEAALRASEVVLDFSRGDAAEVHVEACRKARRALLLGTTGHPPSLAATLDAAAREIALLVAPNTSLGIAVLLDLVQRAAHALPEVFDVEIAEAHHRGKRDAPSGTALAIGEAVARARSTTLAQRRAAPREGVRARKSGEIGFAVVRGGDIVGEHEARFVGEGEELAITHRTWDRSVYARGAVRAAAWLATQPAGRYAMADIFAAETKR